MRAAQFRVVLVSRLRACDLAHWISLSSIIESAQVSGKDLLFETLIHLLLTKA